MKQYRTVNIPATTKNVLVKTSCDLCGSELPDQRICDDIVEITHTFSSGSSDGGWRRETSVDMCNACFHDKLIPWLESQGAECTIKDGTW